MSFQLADLVLNRRRELGMSRQELSRAADVSYPYVSQIETGDRQPSIKTMAKLAQALGLPLSELASAAPESWAGVAGSVPSDLDALASSMPPSSVSVSASRVRESGHDRLLNSVRRRLREVPPLARLEILAELTQEAAREAADEN